MKMDQWIIVIVCLFVVLPQRVFAAGAVNARRQMQMQRQQQMLQQAAVQKQIRQAVAQRQQAAIRQQMIQQKAVIQQQVAQQVAQDAIKKVAIQKAAIHRAISHPKGQITIQQPPVQASMEVQLPYGMQTREEAKAIASLNDVVMALENSSQDWTLIIDPEAKVMVITEFIKRYYRQGIYINKSPAFYAQTIDSMAQADPGMLQVPFEQILKVVAITEYDFDNGQDKDALARKILSPKAYEENRRRLLGQ